MRNAATINTPSLFEAEPLMPLPAPPAEEVEREGPRPQKLAKEFVAWCCSFGNSFRNSPDTTNLRYWLQKVRLKNSDVNESEILIEARRLLLKRIEQSLPKSEEHRIGD